MELSKVFKEIIICIITNFICVLNIFFHEKEMFCSIFLRFTELLRSTLQYTYHKWLQINRLVAIFLSIHYTVLMINPFANSHENIA